MSKLKVHIERHVINVSREYPEGGLSTWWIFGSWSSFLGVVILTKMKIK